MGTILQRLRGAVGSAGLGVKFALPTILSAAFFAVFLRVIIDRQERIIMERVRESGFRLAGSLEQESHLGLALGDSRATLGAVIAIAKDPRVYLAMLVKDDGEILAHTQAVWDDGPVSDPYRNAAAKRTGRWSSRYATATGRQVYDFAVPVYVRGVAQSSRARVALVIDGEMAEIARYQRNTILLGVGVLGAGLVVSIVLARAVARPIRVLVNGTEEIARGNLDHRIPVEGGDEIAQLAQAFNRMTKSVQALIETSRELSSALDTERVLGSIAKYAVGLVGADIVAIAPVSRGAQEAVVRVVLGARTDRLQNYSLTVGRDMGGRFLSVGEPFVSLRCHEDPRVAQDARLAEIIREEGIASLMTVPIMLRGDLVGILWVASRTARTFSQEDVGALQRMAAQAAIALENARLYEDLRRSHDELMAAQEELVRKTRLAAMGEIAAAVAHETRNPLGALINCVELLQGNPNLMGEDAEVLAILKSESQRLNEITSGFLSFGRPRQPDLKPMDLNLLVAHILGLVRRDERCPGSITVETGLDPVLPAVQADEDQLRQVFWNLLLNAVQAMRDGGTLSLRTAVADGSAAVEVQDTGYGIPHDILPKIFEPFYTTRARGTGLGLAIVRRIVEDHGGRVAVSSRQGEGTTFRVTLPLRGPEV